MLTERRDRSSTGLGVALDLSFALRTTLVLRSIGSSLSLTTSFAVPTPKRKDPQTGHDDTEDNIRYDFSTHTPWLRLYRVLVYLEAGTMSLIGGSVQFKQ